MRALLIPSTFVAAFVALPAAAQGDCAAPPATVDTGAPLIASAVETPIEPARLAPLAADSPWRVRFRAAADALLPALRSGEWLPLLGGRWLGEGDRRAVAALLADPCSAFAPLLEGDAPVETRIFGWSSPASLDANERAEILARPEAEALVCWSAVRDGVVWPRNATEANNRAGRPYACARIAYSVRDGTSRWRAFIEGG